jgi:hypothetical protein
MNKMSSLTVAAVVAALLSVSGSAFAQGLTGTLRSTRGEQVAVQNLRGQPAVLVFGGALDPQSPEVLPVLQRLADRYTGRVAVHWVSIDPERSGASGAMTDSQLVEFAARHGYRGSILRDVSGEVFRSINTGRRAQVPTTIVLDANGALVGNPISGFDPEADLVNRLAAVLDKLVVR